jgi:hypothetical protein
LILFGVHSLEDKLEDKNAMRNIPEQFETVELGLGKDIVAWRHFYVHPPDLLSQQDVVEVKKKLCAGRLRRHSACSLWWKS